MSAPLSWGSESNIAGAVRPSGVHDEKMRDRSPDAASAQFLPKTDAAARELSYPLARSRQIQSIPRLGRPVGLPRRLSAFLHSVKGSLMRLYYEIALRSFRRA